MQREALSLSLSSFGISLILIAVLFGGIHFLDTSYPALFPSTIWGLAAGAVVIGSAAYLSRARSEKIGISAAGFIAGLVLYLISDIPFRRYNYFQSSHVLPEVLAGFAAAALAIRFFCKQLPAVLLVAAVFCGLLGFVQTAHGRLLFSDDHPSFLFRLMQLKENFPSIPFYSTEWNGGYDAREFFPSGVLNVFLLFWPFIYLFDVPSIYNLLVGSLFFGIYPGAAFLAARLAGFSSRPACSAALLALLSSYLLFRWFFSYGTIGFLTSAAFLPLALSLAVRAASPEAWSRGHSLLFFAVFSVVLLWPLAALVSLPVVIFVVIKMKSAAKKPGMLSALAALVLVHLPWMLLFAEASNVLGFVLSEKSGKAVHATSPGVAVAGKLKTAYADLRLMARGLNPLILFLALPGFALIARTLFARLLAAQIIWLILLASVSGILRPQLELNRMFMLAAALCCIPAGVLLTSIYDRTRELMSAGRYAAALFYIIPAAVALLIPLRIYAMSKNWTTERYAFATPLVAELTDGIRRCAGGNRVLFAGFTLHELNGGHVAPLPVFSGVPLIAKSYQHDTWTYTDVIPEAYRKRGEAGVTEYLDLYNVGCVVTSDRGWLGFFKRMPKQFHRSHSWGQFTVFKRADYKGDYFVEGEGSVLKRPANGISVKLETPAALLRFNYFDFLESSACRLDGVQVAADIHFVSLKDCPTNTEIEIRSISPIKRLLRIFTH